MSNFTNDNKPEKKKRAFFRYFELVYRRFKDIVALNFFYFLCVLPLLCGMIYFVCSLFDITPETVDAVFFIRAALLFIKTVTPPVFIILFITSLIAYGPMTAGLTYATRSVVEGKHVWYSELFKRAKSNFKQGLVLGIIDIVILLSLLNYISADLSALEGATLVFYRSLKIIAIVASFIYFIMRFYTYTIAVTFDLKLKDIFKNSLIFCVLGFLNNIVSLLVIIVAILSCTSTPRIDVVLIAAFFFSICRFSVLFSTYPIIKKYMLSQIEKEN